jgi:hypothetical protein
MFHIIWTSSFRGKAVLESTNKKQELPVAAIFVHREPPIDASYQVSVDLAKQFQRRRLLKIGLKLLGQMIRKLVGSIYGRSSIKNAHSVPIC